MKEELRALKAMKDSEIDYSDIPERTDWSNTVTGKFYRPRKVQVTLRIDADVLEWFKNTGEKYQTLINNACREYMLRHQKEKKRTSHAKKK